MTAETLDQIRICEKYGAAFCASIGASKLGISKTVLAGKGPINGLRHTPQKGTCGWYILAGDEFSTNPDFFEPLHVSHINDWCPSVIKYLGLAPGWRFQIADDYEDVWFDASLLDV